MPRQRRTEQPRAHWALFALTLVALLATLGLDGFAQENGAGTVQPGRTSLTDSAPVVDGPLIWLDGTQVATRHLPAGNVALTFDDGPDPVWTPRILDVLRRHGAKATFFVVGSQVNKHPELARRIIAEGHQLGLHSFTHRDMLQLPEGQRQIEFALTRNAVAAATGQDVHLFRPPYLASPTKVDQQALGLIEDAGRRGYVTVLADRDTNDWQRPGAHMIAAAVTPSHIHGTIVLMHDGGGDRGQTVRALETVLPELTAQGQRAVTLSQAMPQIPGPTAAATTLTVRGQAFALAQSGSAWVARGMHWLMICATALAGTRIAIQAYCAWRHTRRRRKRPWRPHRPPVTVIVPAYNESANIVATVQSLVSTRYPDLEILVIDDGSSDGTGDLVDALGLPGVRLVRRRNAGKAAALRTGIAEARHDILVLIDGDTVVEPDTIELLVRPFQDPAVGAVAGNAKVANRRGVLGRWQHLEYVVAFNLDRRVFETAQCMPTVPGALGAFRRPALETAGGVSSDTLAEDTDVTMAVARTGWKIAYEDGAIAWTEAPATWAGLWRQRYRWSYGTLQAMWKHRTALREWGAGGKLGRRGLGYIAVFQVTQPLLAPVVDVYLLYSLLFRSPSIVAVYWLGLHVAQLAVAWYAFRLDREPASPLWTLPLQQIGYRQLISLVTIQSAVTALVGTRLRWHTAVRAGRAAATTRAAARTRHLVRWRRLGLHTDPLWARLTFRIGVVLILLSGSAVLAGKALLDRYQSAVLQDDLLGAAATYAGQERTWDLDRPLTVLLIGVDWRKGQQGMIRSDTVMLLHVPRNRNRAYLFSLPRDTIVDIPAFPATGFAGGRDRLNSSFAYGAGLDQDRARGARLLAATVKNLTGLPGLDAAVLIDFYGFSDIITALGGITVCVDADVTSIHTHRVFTKGCHRMLGPVALDYLRQRKTVAHSDYGRQRHQQQFITAIAAEAKRQNIVGNPAKLDSLFRKAGHALTVTTGPATPMELAFSLRNVTPDRITIIKTPGHGMHDAANAYLGEKLEPQAYELFRAVREERVDAFVAAHPELLGRRL